jgi:hypothetical protein
MAYHPPSTPPLTAWARHLDQVMQKRGWSKVQLFEAIGPALGYSPKSRSAVYKLLGDKEPDARTAAVLREHFGEPEPAPRPVVEVETRPADLAAVLAQLTAAISAQTAEIAALRLERAAWERGVLQALAASEGQARAALLDALAPRPPEAARP